MEKKSSATLSTLDRTFDFLELLAGRRQPMSAAEISTAMGITKATTYSMLNSLLRKHYVERVGNTGTYQLGSVYYKYGQLYYQNLPYFRSPVICDVINKVLDELSQKWDAEAHMYCVTDGSILSIQNPELITSGNVQMFLSDYELYATAAGKTAMAFWAEKDLTDYLDRCELKAYTPYTVTDKEELFRELNQIQTQGYSVAHRTLDMNICCMNVPILDNSGKCNISVSLTFRGRKCQLFENHQDEILEDMKEASAEISAQYGYNRMRF